MQRSAQWGWASALAAPVLMVVGHVGAEPLNPMQNPISTYAATAPHGPWVTSSMCTVLVTLACVSVLVSRHQLLGPGPLAHLVVLLAGAAMAGLMLLAVCQETRGSAPAEVRLQAFHDAGLRVFLIASWLLLGLAGALRVLQGPGLGARLAGALVAAAAPLSFLILTWHSALPPGLRQRLGLGCLWCGVVLLLGQARS